MIWPCLGVGASPLIKFVKCSHFIFLSNFCTFIRHVSLKFTLFGIYVQISFRSSSWVQNCVKSFLRGNRRVGLRIRMDFFWGGGGGPFTMADWFAFAFRRKHTSTREQFSLYARTWARVELLFPLFWFCSRSKSTGRARRGHYNNVLVHPADPNSSHQKQRTFGIFGSTGCFFLSGWGYFPSFPIFPRFLWLCQRSADLAVASAGSQSLSLHRKWRPYSQKELL